MVQNVSARLKNTSVEQYKKEERSLIAKRLITSQKRFQVLIKCMRADTITTQEKLKTLKTELHQYSGDIDFKRVRNMGGILETALAFVLRNYAHATY